MLRFHGDEELLKTIGLAVLTLLAIVLPFELKNPLFKIGPLAITSAEIGIYLAAGIWAAHWLTMPRRHWTPAHTAIVAWAVILMLSALMAPAHKAEALKFAFRSLGGCALCFAAASYVRDFKSAVWVGSGLLAGSALSAAAALAEMWVPGAAAILASFKTGPSLTGSYLRASGTFQYANIASMYWEATLSLALAVPIWWNRRRFPRLCRWAAFACVLLLSEAILVAASRAGILIALIVLAGLLLLARFSMPSLRSPAGLSLLSLSVLIVIHLFASDLLMLRLTTPDVSSWYGAEYRDFPADFTLEAGRPARISLTLRNSGRLTWRARGSQSMVLSYHWLDPVGEKIVLWEGARSELPTDVAPGTSVKMESWVIARGKPGHYILQWDMLQEEIAWFSLFQRVKAQAQVLVLPSTSGTTPLEYPPPIDWPLSSSIPRLDLWRAAVRMWLQTPLLGVGPDNYRRLYGAYLGLKRSDDRVYANNLYLEVLATTGLAGALALIWVLVAVGRALRRAWLAAELEGDLLMVAGIGIGCAAFCLHGFADYFLPFTPTYGLFWLLAGMAIGLGYGGHAR